MRLVDPHSGIAALDQRACLELLATQEVGRLGYVSGGCPEIVPVNYVLDGDAVVFATATGSKLWGVIRSPIVFEVDHTDAAARSGWSIILHGLAQEITAADTPALLARMRALRVQSWFPGDKPHLVRLAPRHTTGTSWRA